MTDQAEQRRQVATDLHAIVDLYQGLLTQAVHDANSYLMPGGLAMVALGHVANLEAWGHKFDTAERRALDSGSEMPSIEDDDNWEPPLQTLRYWSERLRTIQGYEFDKQATVSSEASFIGWSLDWMWENEPRWPQFVADIAAARRRLENLLHEGDRDIISEDVTCLACDAALRRRMTHAGIEDEWWCPECKQHLSPPQFNLAASEAARRELLSTVVDDAIGM